MTKSEILTRLIENKIGHEEAVKLLNELEKSSAGKPKFRAYVLQFGDGNKTKMLEISGCCRPKSFSENVVSALYDAQKEVVAMLSDDKLPIEKAKAKKAA
jgi:hypothetical protein